jgi:hypothetical protein
VVREGVGRVRGLVAQEPVLRDTEEGLNPSE